MGRQYKAIIGNKEIPVINVRYRNDFDWDNRIAVSFEVNMTTEDARTTFVDNMEWKLKEEYTYERDMFNGQELYNMNEYCLVATILEKENGNTFVKIGKLTDMESLIEDIYGGVNE